MLRVAFSWFCAVAGICDDVALIRPGRYLAYCDRTDAVDSEGDVDDAPIICY